MPVALQAFNGHLYHVANTAVDYATALALSANTYNGMQGHLVTITSAAENAFVTGLIKTAWFAVDDIAAEGSYKFAAGPEAGSAVKFFAWGAGQPDNLGDEDCLHVWDAYTLPNNWNDLPCSRQLAYVVEYECPVGQVATVSGCQGMHVVLARDCSA